MSASRDSAILQFINTYQGLSKDNLSGLEALYHQDVVFEDPAHRITGWDDLNRYFVKLFGSVNSCEFAIDSWLADNEQAFVTWTMTFSHPDLLKGQPRQVKGCSRLKFQDGQVSYHRDYFDLGEMVYEAVPLLGKIVRHIKKSLGR